MWSEASFAGDGKGILDEFGGDDDKGGRGAILAVVLAPDIFIQYQQ